MMNDGQLSPASSGFCSPTHGAALSMMNDGQLSPASSGFCSPTHGAALSMMNDGQLSPASSAFCSPTHGAALSMMNNDINDLDEEIVWISVDEAGEIDFIHPGSMLVPCEIEEPELLEIGGADNTPLEA